MHIQLLCTSDGRCYVQLDQIRVPFQGAEQARDYLACLQQRIAAPHVLAEAQRRDAEKRQAG
ncbi:MULTISPECIES: hypothetical protein [Pseudomonas]|uniref:hypothetical protein n=1 Tax=Pseudomonas TaxID=286 RepID=UPI000D6F420F|nr:MULTISPECIES: hypothetical protein [unclassified Pseudomonas]MED5608151.1 hypothetical protein [Pseudomonas sp. JH-2]PWU27016.1 hypothetical protein DK254_31345 [Pseudomonas sp. RW407]